MPSQRTGLEEAIDILLEKLPVGKAVTPNELQRSTKVPLSWQTILKAARVIKSAQDQLDERGLVLDVRREGRRYYLTLRRRNLLSMPAEERLAYVRQRYFPRPEEQDYLLAMLYNRGATSSDGAIRLKREKLIEKLLREETLAEAENGRIYLSKEGVTIARGVLKMYPELSRVK